MQRVPFARKIVSQLVEFAPTHCDSVVELGAVVVVECKLPAKVLRALLVAEDFDLVVVDVHVSDCSPLSPAYVREDFRLVWV